MDTVALNSGVATTVADSDLVTVCDSGGSLKPVSFANLMAAVRGAISIGGRNLILNSAKFTGWSAKTGGYVDDGTDGIFSVRKGTGPFKGGYKTMDYVAGLHYTFSIYADSPDGVSMYMRYVSNSLGTQTAYFGTYKSRLRQVSDGWYQHSVTALCTVSGSAFLEFETSSIDNTRTIRFCAPKLEIGNVATDWSPAPEDIKSSWGGGNCKILKYLQFRQERRPAC